MARGSEFAKMVRIRTIFRDAGAFEFAKMIRIRTIFSEWQRDSSSQNWFGSELFFRNGRKLRVRKNSSDPNYFFGMAGGFEFAKMVRIRTIFSGWQGALSSQNWFGSELSFRNGFGIAGGL